MKTIVIKGGKSGKHHDISVGLKDRNDTDLGKNQLGLVQSIIWKAKVGDLSRCYIETIMTEAELETALKDVEIGVRIRSANPCPACKKKQDKIFAKLLKKLDLLHKKVV